MIRQRSIRNSIAASGIGVHTGQRIGLKLHPAEPDTGLKIRRTDRDLRVDIPLRADSVIDTRLSTAVGVESSEVSTVEHLVSALAGLHIDNAVLEVDGPEIPIMDGSASPFVFLIESAGPVEQDAPRRYLRVLETVEVRDEHSGAWARLTPHEGLKLSFTLTYDHPVLALHPDCSIDLDRECYIREISRARTFGFVEDLQRLRADGKGLGASRHNAVALDQRRVLNEEGLRYPDEFTRHKILDALGDLYLAGYPLLGHFTGHGSGHALNNRLVRKLLATPSAWQLTGRDAAEGTDSAVPLASPLHRMPTARPVRLSGSRSA